MEKLLIFLDCEGPLTKNDNAFELTEALAANISGLGAEVGRKFFERMSVIDDIWGDFGKIRHFDPNYSSGHTLKVMLPFFLAMSATSEKLEEISKKKLLVVPNVKETLAELLEKAEVYIISTSYNFYLQAFCSAVRFPMGRVECTQVVDYFDDLRISRNIVKELLNFMETVARLPVIEYDQKTGVVIPDHQWFYDFITNFIWPYILNSPLGSLLTKVKPIGQKQKAEAVKRISDEMFWRKSQKRMYVGDSQTDVASVKFVKDGGGLTMMFNGKGPVCALSDLMYIGESANIISSMAEIYSKLTKEDILKRCSPHRQHGGEMIATVTPNNVAMLEEMSVAKRKEFRGVHIGGLT